MRYSRNNWKKKIRTDLFGWLPPSIYFKIFPIYFRIVNKKRRESKCEFKIDGYGRLFAIEEGIKLYFLDHRRLDRYMYKDGLRRIKNIMQRKYCNDKCAITKNDIVVEIGANIGEFTLAAADQAKQVYAFEPDPSCLDCLKLNTDQLENVQIVKKGASDKNKKLTFYVSSEDADSSFIKPKKYTKKLEIDAIRLDTWMQEAGLDRIDFLKVEAEGAEIEVLKGLGDRIKNVQKISVDGGPERNGEPTFKDVQKFLQAKGLHTHIEGWQVYAWQPLN